MIQRGIFEFDHKAGGDASFKVLDSGAGNRSTFQNSETYIFSYDRPTDRPTDRQTDRRAHGEVSLPICNNTKK